MFDRYDSHNTTTIQNIRSGPDGTQVLVIVTVLAVAVAAALYMLAAMVWAVVAGVISVAAIGGAVLINRDIQKTRQAREYRIVELAARQAAGVSPDALYPPMRVLDAVPARALPAGGQVRVNGAREASTSSARRR